MKVSINWLSDYVDLDLPVNELAEKISRTAVEIEGQSQPQGNMKNVVIAKVLSVEEHPDSDHMVITQIDAGEAEPVQIVTGAPNVAVGQTVILAKHGSVIGGGQKIKKGKLRGVASNGMLAALQELGFDDKVAPKDFEDGIWVFNDVDAADLVAGADALAALGLNDHILETGITPNRADMLSMNGTAWEVAAILDQKVTLPDFELVESDKETASLITATAPAELASKYAVRVVENVTIQDSPLWLQRRLWNMGVRPINNVVDVTNYMLLMYGQPLHAFDLDQLPTRDLNVRRAQAHEQIKTLDGVEREAAPEDIIIAAGEQGLMFAGVMGGESTEVTGQTTNIVLEGAVFEATAIRKTAQKQNLHSEASQRFERGVDVEATFVALDHAAALIATLAGGSVTKGRVIAQDYAYQAPVVSVTVAQVNKVLGTEITQEAIAKIFDQLQFTYTVNDAEFMVTIPSRRWDISLPADLIEEVARLYGYDKLPATLPTGATTPGILTAKQMLIRASRRALEGLGLDQAISYVLTTPQKAQDFKLHQGSPIVLDYPMSQDRSQTRSSLLTGLLDDVAYNVARKQKNVALYEQGRVFVSDDEATLPSEIEHLAGVITGEWTERTWTQPAQVSDFFVLKGIVMALLDNFALADRVSFEASVAYPEMHPGRTAELRVGQRVIGIMGQVHPKTAKAYKVGETYAFELDLDAIMAIKKRSAKYEAISRYPAITRDLAILVDQDITAAELVAKIEAAGGNYLHDVVLFDLYTGANVADDKKSLAYTLHFVNPAATLVDDEVNAAVDRITKQLKQAFDAEIR